MWLRVDSPVGGGMWYLSLVEEEPLGFRVVAATGLWLIYLGSVAGKMAGRGHRHL